MVLFNSDEWSPLREMARVQEELDRAFRRGSAQPGANELPHVNVWAADEGLVLTAELPGCSGEDVAVTVDGDSLTLAGRRLEQEPAEGARYLRRERAYGEFARTLRLPFHPSPEQVEARFQSGVLEIRVARPEAQRPRKIEVRAEASQS